MADAAPEPARAAARRPFVAGLLTFLVSGLGQLHCGRCLRALVLFAVAIAVDAMSLLEFVHIRMYPLNLIAAAGLWIGWRFWTVADAVRLARRADAEFPLRWFTSLPVLVVVLVLYLAFGVMRPAMLLRDHVLEAFRMPARSMSDTILPGDRFLADKLPRVPARGDIVVYWTEAEGPSVRFVHRIIGLPGETVEVRGTRAFVGGRELSEPYVTRQGGLGREGFGPATVPADHYFLLGDLRDSSRDSRVPEVGFVPRDRIVGRAMTIFMSEDPETGDVRWNRIGRVIR